MKGVGAIHTMVREIAKIMAVLELNFVPVYMKVPELIKESHVFLLFF